MNDSKREVNKLPKKSKNSDTNVNQIRNHNNRLERSKTSINIPDQKVPYGRERTFVKNVPDKEISSPHLSEITSASRNKQNVHSNSQKNDPKKFRSATTVEGLPFRSQSAYKSDSGATRTTARPRSVSPTPSKLPSPAGAQFQIKKFYSYHMKIVEQLEALRNSINVQPDEAESLSELHRQRKRANEFGVRFSRNHLYQLRRLVNEIKKNVVPYPFDTLSKNECDSLCRRIFLAYQATSQALQTYINYVAFAQSSDVPEKVKELLIIITDLYLCSEHMLVPYLKNTAEKGDVIKNCREMENLLDAKISENDSRNLKNKTESDPPKNNRSQSKKYSMYKAKATNPSWKKKTEMLAKAKFGPPPKRTKKDDEKARVTCDIYTQKMHPTCGKYFGNKFVKFDPMKLAENSKSQTPSEKKVFARRARYNTPREVTSQDEDVETMVQSFADDDTTTCRKTASSSSASNLSDKSDKSTHLGKNELQDVLLEAIKHLETNDKAEQKTSLKKLLKTIQPKKTKAVETPSNVKVFHVKSRDMICDGQKPGTEEALTPAEVDITHLFKEQKAKEAIVLKERKLNIIFKPMKHKKVTSEAGGEPISQGKVRLTISDEMKSNVMRYRKMFKEFCKNNIMYQKNMARKPWEVVANISDYLISDILTEISSGIEDGAILRRLYLNELLEVM